MKMATHEKKPYSTSCIVKRKPLIYKVLANVRKAFIPFFPKLIDGNFYILKSDLSGIGSSASQYAHFCGRRARMILALSL